MNSLRLYRGISAPVGRRDELLSKIKGEGLAFGQGPGDMSYSFGLNVELLVNKRNLSQVDTESESSQRVATYACGTREGAAYYAWRYIGESSDLAPIMIEFDAKVLDVRVDGKDFLYKLFEMGEPEKAKLPIRQLFGRKALYYAEAAWASGDHSRKLALCDLATMDPQVINDHYANRSGIGGRYGTVFHNAFVVALPISRTDIVNVWSPSARHRPLIPEFQFSDYIHPRN